MFAMCLGPTSYVLWTCCLSLLCFPKLPCNWEPASCSCRNWLCSASIWECVAAWTHFMNNRKLISFMTFRFVFPSCKHVLNWDASTDPTHESEWWRSDFQVHTVAFNVVLPIHFVNTEILHSWLSHSISVLHNRLSSNQRLSCNQWSWLVKEWYFCAWWNGLRLSRQTVYEKQAQRPMHQACPAVRFRREYTLIVLSKLFRVIRNLWAQFSALLPHHLLTVPGLEKTLYQTDQTKSPICQVAHGPFSVQRQSSDHSFVKFILAVGHQPGEWITIGETCCWCNVLLMAYEDLATCVPHSVSLMSVASAKEVYIFM